jgi:hypothetical protein
MQSVSLLVLQRVLPTTGGVSNLRASPLIVRSRKPYRGIDCLERSGPATDPFRIGSILGSIRQGIRYSVQRVLRPLGRGLEFFHDRLNIIRGCRIAIAAHMTGDGLGVPAGNNSFELLA